MNKTLEQCDDDIGLLLEMIDNDTLLRTNLNVIITSDHGMHSIDKAHKIVLENYIDKSLFSAYGARSFANIFVKNSEFFFRNRRRRTILHGPTFDCFLFQKTISIVSIAISLLFPIMKSIKSRTYRWNTIIKRMFALVVSDPSTEITSNSLLQIY